MELAWITIGNDPDHWTDLPLPTALLNSSFQGFSRKCKAGLTPETVVNTGGEVSSAPVMCWGPTYCSSKGRIRKIKHRSFWIQLSWKHQIDIPETDGHGLFSELWQQKLWQQIRLPLPPLLLNTYLQPNPCLCVSARAERKQITQLVCWYTDTFLLHWW